MILSCFHLGADLILPVVYFKLVIKNTIILPLRKNQTLVTQAWA